MTNPNRRRCDMTFRSLVLGCGGYLPERIVTNAELGERLDTTDSWITQRTGIRQRHVAAPGELTSDLAVRAGARALAAAGRDAGDIDLVVLATATPDHTFPATAAKVAARLGVKTGFPAFDVQAVCTGFVYALAVADNFLRCGQAKRALVIGAETFSRILDWNDRSTAVLFGDGAGAVVIEGVPSNGSPLERGILSTHLHADGASYDLLYVNGGPSTTGTSGFLRMEGREVFRLAVQRLAEVADEALAANGLHRVRYRLARSAPGQPAHHRRHGQEARARRGPRGGDDRPPCQHLRRLGAAGARGGNRGRAHSTGTARAAGGDGRRPDLGRGSHPLVMAIAPGRHPGSQEIHPTLCI